MSLFVNDLYVLLLDRYNKTEHINMYFVFWSADMCLPTYVDFGMKYDLLKGITPGQT